MFPNNLLCVLARKLNQTQDSIAMPVFWGLEECTVQLLGYLPFNRERASYVLWNTIQILISSCHPTLLPVCRICALGPRAASGCLLVLWDLGKMVSCCVMVTGSKKQ